MILKLVPRFSQAKMSGNPPIERLISVDIESEGPESVVVVANSAHHHPQPPNNNPLKDTSRAVAKGGEVTGNCIVDEGYDTIQTYQGFKQHSLRGVVSISKTIFPLFFFVRIYSRNGVGGGGGLSNVLNI